MSGLEGGVGVWAGGRHGTDFDGAVDAVRVGRRGGAGGNAAFFVKRVNSRRVGV